MRPRLRCAAVAGAVLAMLVPARAADVTQADLQAAVRSLGFVDSLRQRPTIAIDVVYADDDAAAKALAQRSAAALSKLRGSGSSQIEATAVSTGELGRQHPDVLYLMPGLGGNARAVADFSRQHRVLSISSDPACLDEHCCTLMIRGGSNVSIVLDTAMAQQTGTQFAAVFTMMVSRR